MKGVGAEADAVAGILAGSAENIRPAVALCEELSYYGDLSRIWEIAVLRLSFFILD